MEQEGRLIMPSLRSSIRKRLEEAEQDNPAEEPKAIRSSRPTIRTIRLKQAAAEAIQTKLDEQP